MSEKSVLQRWGAGAALTAVLLALSALLIAPTASAADNCVYAFEPKTGALAGRACVDPKQIYLKTRDDLKDGHHVTGYWSTTGDSDSCEVYGGDGARVWCVMAPPGGKAYNHVQICFRVALMEGPKTLYKSQRACVTMNNGDF